MTQNDAEVRQRIRAAAEARHLDLPAEQAEEAAELLAGFWDVLDHTGVKVGDYGRNVTLPKAVVDLVAFSVRQAAKDARRAANWAAHAELIAERGW